MAQDSEQLAECTGSFFFPFKYLVSLFASSPTKLHENSSVDNYCKFVCHCFNFCKMGFFKKIRESDLSHHFHTHEAKLNCHKMFLCFLCSEMENYISFSFHLLQRCKTPWGATQRFKTRRSFLWAQKWFLCVWIYVCMCVGASCEKWTWRKKPSMGFSGLASALQKRAALCILSCFTQMLYEFPCSLMEQGRCGNSEDVGQFLAGKNSSLHMFTFFWNTALVLFKCLLLCTR